MKKSWTDKPVADEKSESARDRILDAAFTLFTKRGYGGVSTLDIATLAKVSKRELYAHFKNKQALLETGIVARAKRMRVPLELPNVTTRPALESVLASFGTATLWEISDPHVVAVHRLAAAEALNSPEVAATLQEYGRQANQRALAGFMRAAQAAKLVEEGNPTELAERFLALLSGDLMIRLILNVSPRPTKREIEKRAQDATALFLKLYAT